MIIREIREELFRLQDKKYRDFQSKLNPSVDPESFIGVRTPELRKLAKQIRKRKDVYEFLEELPHLYFDENQLHAFLISDIKEYKACLVELEHFLPFVDNWATCDQMSPKVFKKYHDRLPEQIEEWMRSEETYTMRFAIKMLMQHFLEEDFRTEYPEMVACIRSEEYYINMMIAWYFATGLAKQYEKILPFLEDRKLDVWTHNKTIQKAVESSRITPDQKIYLKSLRIKY